MSRQQITRGIVLRLSHSGESFLRVDLLSPELGVCCCLKRISSKQQGKERPDLFDEAEVLLEAAKQGGLQFIKEYRVLERREAIGQTYQCLKHASDFAAILAENGPHMADTELLYQLCERTLRAFTEPKAPEIVFLKALYLLLKDEGYPIKETWWTRLAPDLKLQTKSWLAQPSPDKLPTEERSKVERIHRSLYQWLTHETDLRLPNSLLGERASGSS